MLPLNVSKFLINYETASDSVSSKTRRNQDTGKGRTNLV